jgi:hypothetical protein
MCGMLVGSGQRGTSPVACRKSQTRIRRGCSWGCKKLLDSGRETGREVTSHKAGRPCGAVIGHSRSRSITVFW